MDEMRNLIRHITSKLTYSLETKNFLEAKVVILEDMNLTLEREKERKIE
jgi:hypothetical protein